MSVCKACNVILGIKTRDPINELCNSCLGTIREFVNFKDPDNLPINDSLEGDYDE